MNCKQLLLTYILELELQMRLLASSYPLLNLIAIMTVIITFILDPVLEAKYITALYSQALYTVQYSFRL